MRLPVLGHQWLAQSRAAVESAEISNSLIAGELL